MADGVQLCGKEKLDESIHQMRAKVPSDMLSLNLSDKGDIRASGHLPP